MAQSMSGGAPSRGNLVGSERPEKAKIAPPPAVPGAVARPGTVAPADRTAADLPPTEALFDAINRGDIATARDAVSRGADIDATNLLGLTPLELSIDLSRNDITFLLLSLRGGGSPSKNAAAPQEAAAPLPATRRQSARQAPPRQSVAVEAPQPVRQTPALFAGNGGSAVPAAGFLGFDAKK
jgi:hypothetical protein